MFKHGSQKYTNDNPANVAFDSGSYHNTRDKLTEIKNLPAYDSYTLIPSTFNAGILLQFKLTVYTKKCKATLTKL